MHWIIVDSRIIHCKVKISVIGYSADERQLATRKTLREPAINLINNIRCCVIDNYCFIRYDKRFTSYNPTPH